MGSQVIAELYRTNEDKTNYTFTSCVTITYFGECAFVQGLSGTFTTTCFRELLAYLQSKGIHEAKYYRKGRLKIKQLQKAPVEGALFTPYVPTQALQDQT